MPVEITVSGILFDMDGTLVDSTPAVETSLGEWAEKQGMTRQEFFHVSHGVRTRDNVKKFQTVPKPGSELSEEELVATVDALEVNIATTGARLKAEGGRGIERLPGVAKLLAALHEGKARWGIVTSATKTYADIALETAGIVPPELPFIITGDVCTHGKPHPEPYLTGLEALKKLAGCPEPLDPSTVLVFEDAPSGLTAGLAAGCKTLAVCTGQTRERIRGIEATIKTVDLERVEVVGVSDEGVKLRITTLEEEEAQEEKLAGDTKEGEVVEDKKRKAEVVQESEEAEKEDEQEAGVEVQAEKKARVEEAAEEPTAEANDDKQDE